ncbi:acetyltransferase [filamentous cyanobacterium CCP4]|nr:acetyltransferase [filamentous cyanobacterium CCP4]
MHGQVMVDPGAVLAAGVTVQADPNATVRLGSACVLQEGTTIYGRTQGRVLGDDRVSYAVWVGDRAFLAYKVLVQSPVYIGPDCFIGFRSTLYNARLGAGCVVMMHALVQDVAIPPGKLVPSGSVITQQHQADSLPDVGPADRALVNELSETSGFAPPTDWRKPTSFASSDRTADSTERDGFGTMTSQLLPPDVVQRARQYLAQGLAIGTEHADSRRYRSGVWQTCSPIQSNRESEVIAALEACLAEHSGEYVRMFGIDPRAKQRVAPITIQRADGKPVAVSGSSSVSAPSNHSSHGAYRPAPASSSSSSGPLSPEVVQQVRQYLSQGYRIGTEHADARRYNSNVWQSCTPIGSTREGDVMAAINTCIAEHPNEYVRVFGIDPKAKRRISAVTVQRPGSKSAPDGSSGSSYSAPASSPASSNGSAPMGGLSQDLVQQVNQLVNQGYRLSLEHADVRRYRSGAWQTGGTLEGNRTSDVLAALESQLRNHSGQYVRLIGIDPKVKKRVLEATIQRP